LSSARSPKPFKKKNCQHIPGTLPHRQFTFTVRLRQMPNYRENIFQNSMPIIPKKQGMARKPPLAWLDKIVDGSNASALTLNGRHGQ
jgi:hypothetical protein